MKLPITVKIISMATAPVDTWSEKSHPIWVVFIAWSLSGNTIMAALIIPNQQHGVSSQMSANMSNVKDPSAALICHSAGEMIWYLAAEMIWYLASKMIWLLAAEMI